MAASNRKKSSRAKKKSTQNVQRHSSSGKFQTEIILLVILAACIILMVSNFGLGGFVGDAISSFCFGAMGVMAYIFPVLLFIQTAFVLSNRRNSLAYRKLAASAFLFVVLCGAAQLFMEGYMDSTTLTDYYSLSSSYRTGGGIIGGAVCISTVSAFGTVGSYIIIILVVLICLIIITQRSLIDFISGLILKISDLIGKGSRQYKEGAPERKIRRDQRRQQFMQQRQQRREEKIRKLEEELAMEEEEEEDSFPDPEDARPVTEGAFLEGTNLKKEIQEEVPPFSEKKAARRPSKKKSESSQKEITEETEKMQEEISIGKTAEKAGYSFPPLSLLKKGNGKVQGDSEAHLKKTAQKLQEVLRNFGVNVTILNVSCGPTVTRYELQPEMGVKVSRIVNLADDIKLNLATPDIRIEAPIPGKAAVGIEVPNKENSTVMLRDLLQSEEFQKAKSKLSFAVGKDIGGKTIVADIAKMPHLLIAGATGSGKSVCINTLIISILYKASPDEVKLIMIDPKVVELSVYNGIPHLFIPVVTDPKKAAGALNWAVSEMTNRYNTFAEYGVRNLSEYNRKIETFSSKEGEEPPARLPQIIIIVDELADLMMVAPGEVEDSICRLAQLARAAGIHLIIATQRPSVNVITGLIKANMPSRIAFAVSSGVDSRTILDMNGAEKLLGKGDMLFYPQGYQKPVRLQGAFVSDAEVSSVVSFLSEKNPGAQYDQNIQQQVNTPVLSSSQGEEEKDVYFKDAGRFIIEKDKASIGMLQRMFKIGFNRAARIMDQLCDAGVVGPEEGTKPRKILMTKEEFENYIEESL
ncbi:MAG: DNA translocase FtsK 4TM domain-containing protein [Clostridia bacterium]|nr:DNA translocase FtsK 4TM domain-containing protein [Clostridia bacterium]MDY5555150.1 DNA translocase FtsK 4TM domain-containing protein [Blautia sp.]